MSILETFRIGTLQDDTSVSGTLSNISARNVQNVDNYVFSIANPSEINIVLNYSALNAQFAGNIGEAILYRDLDSDGQADASDLQIGNPIRARASGGSNPGQLGSSGILNLSPGDYYVTIAVESSGNFQYQLTFDFQNVIPTPLPGGFNPAQYAASNPDLILALGTNLAAFTQHYLSAGRLENRSIDSFDELLYTASNPDLIQAFGLNGDAATNHYIQSGFREGRAINSFDAQQYLASHRDLLTAFGTDINAATRHYVQSGFRENRSPDSFDEFRYIASHGDLIQAFGLNGDAATNHYLVSGISEQRSTTAFDPLSYMNRNPDVAAFYNNDPSLATLHYISTGFFEGRTIV